MSEKMPIYAIFIARARERMEAQQGQANALHLDFRPVQGVDGKTVPPVQWEGFSRVRSRLRAGRDILPGEYGCYRSHVAALSAFVASGEPYATIVEDDVVFVEGLEERLLAIARTMPADAIVKVTNHRHRGFRRKFTTALGDAVGRCHFGPQGSSACYVVSRQGAMRFLERASVMTQPYDKALECGWGYGTRVYVTGKDFMPYGLPDSLVGTRDDYRSSKHARLKRLPAFVMRLFDHIARFVYAFA